MSSQSLVTVILATALAALLAPAESKAVSEKALSLTVDAHLDAAQSVADYLHLQKREAEPHHVAKREASMRLVVKRQTDTTELERLLYTTSVMFLEAYQAFDTVVMDEIIELSDQINATIKAGGAPTPVVTRFSNQIDAIKQNVSRYSVLPKNCGRDPQRTSNLLQGSLPWTVSMGVRNGDKVSVGCIGVIISPYHVLVEASCVAVTRWDMVVTNDGEYKIAERWIHRLIDSAEDLKAGHNIGLLMLKGPIKFNDKVQPSCLPGVFDSISPISQNVNTLVGIESIPQGGVRVYNWPNSRTSGPLLCHELIGSYNRENPTNQNNFVLKVSHVCVWRPYNEADNSMVMTEDNSGRVKVIGVGPVSDSNVKIPIVYTQTHTHLFWIELMVKNSIKLLA